MNNNINLGTSENKLLLLFVQVVRGSTNLSRDDEGATQDRSNAPITNTNDQEQVEYST